MDAELTFYTNPMSRGRIVRWMLEEVGAPYRTEIVSYGPAMQSPAYLAINPMAKVPALTHGDIVITEAAAICAYLADAFPECGFAPAPDDRLRGSYLRWMFFAAGPVEAAVSDKALGVQIPPDRERMMGYRNFATVMDVLEDLVADKTFLIGDRFSAVDVYLGSQIGWGLSFGTFEKRPAFERYWKGLAARPAYVRAAAIDESAISPPKA